MGLYHKDCIVLVVARENPPIKIQAVVSVLPWVITMAVVIPVLEKGAPKRCY